MSNTSAHVKFEKEKSVNKYSSFLTERKSVKTVRWTDGHTDDQRENMILLGVAGHKRFVPFRSAKFQFTGVNSILRNGTEQMKEDRIPLKDGDLLNNL